MWEYKLADFLMECKIKIGIEGLNLRCLNTADILLMLFGLVFYIIHTALVILITIKIMDYKSKVVKIKEKNLK